MRTIIALLLLCACDPLSIGVNRSALSVAWDLEIDPSTAVLDAGRVESLTTATGQVFSAVGLGPSLAGREAGGVAPLTFDADSRLHSEDAIASGGVTGYTVEIVHRPADASGSLDRGYLLYVENDTNASTSHHVIAHTANELGFDQKGTYIAGSWVIAPSDVQVYTGLTVETWVVRPSGSVAFLRNGHEVDLLSWTPSTLYLDDLWLGSAYGSPLTAAYRGQIYSVRAKASALTRAQVMSAQQEQIDRFAIRSDYAWQPMDEGSLTGWWAEHRMLRTAGDVYQWGSRPSGLLSQGYTAQQPSTTRVGGNLALSCDGTDENLGGYPIATYLGASSYEWATKFTPHSCNSTTGAAYTLEFILGDTSGFVWGALKSNGAGGCTAVVGHWGTSAQSVELPGVTLGDTHTLDVWFASGTLHAALDGAEVTPRTSTTSIGTTNTGLKVCGRGTSSTSLEVDISTLVTFSAALSADSRAELNTWLSEVP